MRIGNVTGMRSRREKRREKEAKEDRERTFRREEKKEAVERVMPAKLKRRRAAPSVIIPDNETGEFTKRSKPELPKQRSLIARAIQVRQHVEIVTEEDRVHDVTDVRHSVIEDIDNKGRLYLTQTSPPILRSHVGQLVELTFLNRYRDVPGGRWLRVGYKTPIEQLLLNYQIGPKVVEHIVLVKPPKELHPSSIRMAFRIKPPDDLDLRLILWPENRSLNLLDISGGGARFYHSRRWFFAKGRKITVAVASGKLRIVMPAVVVRAGTIRDRYGLDHGVTSIRFDSTDPTTRHRYLSLLTEVYRHMLAQRSGSDRI